jgi:aspartate racemase
MGTHAHPEISLHTLSFADYVACLDDGNLEGVAELMLISANKLAATGADFLICPDNTIHESLPWVLPKSPLPWLHIAEVAAAKAKERGFRRVGITGTQWLIRSNVYPAALDREGIAWMRPPDAVRDELGRMIMEELVHGDFKPETVAYFQQVISDFKAQGCEAVVLGCTEIPLIIGDHNSALPTLDSTRLLARAAIKKALS